MRYQNVQVEFDRRNFGLGLAEAGQELVDFNGDDPQPPPRAAANVVATGNDSSRRVD